MADTLKVYVDSTSLSLVRQVADFVTTADDPDHHHLLTWLRLPLTPAQLQGLNAEYLPQLAAVQADFITRVRRTLAETGARRLVVHGNQTHAWRGVMPILAALQACMADGTGFDLELRIQTPGGKRLVRPSGDL